MRLNRIAALCVAGFFAITLAGCSTPFGERLSAAFSVITSASAATVDPKAVLIAADIFDGVQATAKNYLRLPRCTGTNGPICRDSRATVPIINAVQAGRKARRAAVDFLKTHPGQLGSAGLYDALQISVRTIQDIFFTYNVDATVAAAKAR